VSRIIVELTTKRLEMGIWNLKPTGAAAHKLRSGLKANACWLLATSAISPRIVLNTGSDRVRPIQDVIPVAQSRFGGWSAALTKFFDGKPDRRTLELLSVWTLTGLTIIGGAPTGNAD
jgi:hypothetical protein